MTPAARRDAILRQAQSGQRLLVEQLSAEFAASRETIRPDLAELDQQGLLRRVHGGATLAVQSVQEGPFNDRIRQQVAAKRAIARYVAQRLQPSDRLFIDTGSTTLFLAEELSKHKGLIVITNPADIATLCQRGAGNRVVLVGGESRGPGGEAAGPMAVAQISQLRAARAIRAVAAVTERDIFDIDPQEAEVARAIITQADEVTVLAHHT